MAEILAQLAKVDGSLNRVSREIFKCEQDEMRQEDSDETTVKGESEGEDDEVDTGEEGDGGDHVAIAPPISDSAVEKKPVNAVSLGRAVARRFKRKTVGKPEPVAQVFPPHAEVLVRILEENRGRAAAANALLRPMCSDTVRGLDPSFFVDFAPIGKASDTVVEAVRTAVEERQKSRMLRSRQLRKEYSVHRAAWTKRTKQVRDKRSREKREALWKRDKSIYRLVHGNEPLMSMRTSSGRTTTKVVAGVTPGGAHQDSEAEVENAVKAIYEAGGTPDARFVWSRTLAVIPDQDTSNPPLDCGSVLIEDPAAMYINARTINPWSREETLIFLEKYMLYQKNFSRVASFLEHKVTADCVRFYYENKLRLNLKQLLLKRKSTKRAHLLALAGLRRQPDPQKHRLGIHRPSANIIDGVRSTYSGDGECFREGSSSPRISHGSPVLGGKRRQDGRSPKRRAATLANAPPSKRMRAFLKSSEEEEEQQDSPVLQSAGDAGSVLDFTAKHDELEVSMESSVASEGKAEKHLHAGGEQLKSRSKVLAVDGHDKSNSDGDKVRKVGKEMAGNMTLTAAGGADDKNDGFTSADANMAVEKASTNLDRPAESAACAKNDERGETRDGGERHVDLVKGTGLLTKAGSKDTALELKGAKDLRKAVGGHSSTGKLESVSVTPQPKSSTRSEEAADDSSPPPVASPKDESHRPRITAVWTPKDQALFKELYEQNDKSWRKVAELMPSKSPGQVKGYWRKMESAASIVSSRKGDGKTGRGKEGHGEPDSSPRAPLSSPRLSHSSPKASSRRAGADSTADRKVNAGSEKAAGETGAKTPSSSPTAKLNSHHHRHHRSGKSSKGTDRTPGKHDELRLEKKLGKRAEQDAGFVADSSQTESGQGDNLVVAGGNFSGPSSKASAKPSPPRVPGVRDAQPATVPTAPSVLPKFRSAPPVSGEVKPGGSASRPSLTRPNGVSSIPMSAIPSFANRGGIAGTPPSGTPRAPGGSRLQDIVNRARAAGFISERHAAGASRIPTVKPESKEGGDTNEDGSAKKEE